MRRGRHCLLLIAALAGVFAAGAGEPLAAGQKKKAPAAAKTELVWPLPPEQPRIRYLATYRGFADFKQKTSRWIRLLLGPDQMRTVEALVKPYGVTAAPNGRVYVTDTAVRKVFVFDPTAKTVGFVGESGVGRVVKPIGVAADDDGRVFVADATLNRVFGYGPDGALAIAIGREGELENPSGLALDRKLKRIYVADATKHQVLCYSAADGAFIRAIGERGVDPGQFNFPTNLFVDQQSRLYVADTMNFRVQVFDAEGKVLTTFGSQGDTAGKLNRPKGVGVDSEGHIYVADASFNNFQIFDAEGALLLFVGLAGGGPGEFFLPAGLFVDDRDRIYVADQGNARVQVFEYIKAPK